MPCFGTTKRTKSNAIKLCECLGVTLKEIDISNAVSVHFEDIGLDKNAPQGFGNFLRRAMFDKVPFKSVSYLNGQIEPQRACEEYTRLLMENPVDVVFMGIGENGHIAFNDPHVAHFDDSEVVKVVDLDEKCRRQQVNDGCFATIDDVPTHAMTLTIPTLTKAARLFCVVPAASLFYNYHSSYRLSFLSRCVHRLNLPSLKFLPVSRYFSYLLPAA